MSKVTVVGAGNVGATCANVLAFNEVADEVVMLDVKEGVSEGKAMDMMQTYAEESPSGTGVHLLFTGQKPAGACRKSSIGLEMYDGGRYFTVTGKALNDLAIEERTAQCAAVHAKYRRN